MPRHSTPTQSVKMYKKASADDDPHLSEVKFFLHGNSSVLDCERILKHGFEAREGRPTISTDLAHAVDWATTTAKRMYSKSPTQRDESEWGMVFVLRRPKGLSIGYGMSTTLGVYTDAKEIKGAPIKYASARKQLAFYSGSDTEALRKELELRAFQGQEPPLLHVSPEDIQLVIHPTDELIRVIESLRKETRAFVAPDYARVTQTLLTLVKADERTIVSSDTSLQEIVQQLVASTVVSIVLSRIRNLQLDVKSALGYHIFREDGSVKDSNASKTKEYIEDLYQKAHAAGLSMGEPWLDEYLKTQSELLRAELA